jgi:tetratricopeptide (TPR) repeat protein
LKTNLIKKLKIIIVLFFLFLSHLGNSQSQNPIFLAAMKKLQAAEYEAGIKLLDEVLKENTKDYPALFNRAVAKSMLKNFDAAIMDIDKAIEAKPDAKKAYLHRAIIRKKLAKYDLALTDLEKAIQMDPNFGDAYMNKGLLHEYLGKFDEACTAFKKAKELALATAYPKVDFCETPANERIRVNSILKLEVIATDKTYGFSPKNPIKVGTGANGALENEQTYFDLLRDETGQHVKYIFKEKGPDFPSKTGLGGKAFLTKYEIKYLQKDGKIKTANIFFNHFEYNEPQILAGFQSVK